MTFTVSVHSDFLTTDRKQCRASSLLLPSKLSLGKCRAYALFVACQIRQVLSSSQFTDPSSALYVAFTAILLLASKRHGARVHLAMRSTVRAHKRVFVCSSPRRRAHTMEGACATALRFVACNKQYLYTEQMIDLHCLVYKSCCHSYEARLKISFTAQQTNPMFQLATTRIYLVFVKG
jgi:hypothetical protein